MNKTLELTFMLSNDKTFTLSITNPKPNLSEQDINAAMDTIVASNYFKRDGATIVGKKRARFVERAVTDVALV